MWQCETRIIEFVRHLLLPVDTNVSFELALGTRVLQSQKRLPGIEPSTQLILEKDYTPSP